GEAVLQALRAGGSWDALVLDINMPGMDGLQTAAAVRQMEAPLCDVPIVALTAYSDDATLRAAQATGMNRFITKPVEAAVLYQAVRRAYVPMVETQAWPAHDDWAGRIAALAAETVQALHAYGASQGASHE